MLRKLLKYEFKATMRNFVPIYIAILLMAIVNRVISGGVIDDEGQGLSIAILFELFVSLVVITIVVIVQRFNKNLLGDEGYLMFTLPVSSESHIISKAIISVFWAIASCFIAICTFIIIFGTLEGFKEALRNLDEIWAELWRASEGENSLIVTIGKGGLLFVLGYITFVFQIYLSLAFAQLPVLAKHRNLVGFGAFFIISTIISYIGNCFTSLLNSFISIVNVTICYEIALIAVMFLGIRWLLNKHLNLE